MPLWPSLLDWVGGNAGSGLLVLRWGNSTMEKLETFIQHSWRLGLSGKGHFFVMSGAVAGDFNFLSLGHVGKAPWLGKRSSVKWAMTLFCGGGSPHLSSIWVHGHDLLNPGRPLCKGATS